MAAAKANEVTSGDVAVRRDASRWVSLLLLGFGVAILAAFAATTNFRQIGEAIGRIQPPLFGLAIVAVFAQLLVKAARWRFMVWRLTGTRISIRFGAISIIAGVAAGSIAPGRSFEVAKAILLKGSFGVPLRISTSAMIVERILDIVFLIATFLLAAAFVPSRMVLASHVVLVTIAALVFCSALVVALPAQVQGWVGAVLRRIPVPERVRERVVNLVETFFTSFLVLRQHRTLWSLLGLTAVAAALDIARVFTVFRAMGITLGLALIAFSYLGAAMLGMALLIPGGVGVTEVSMAGLIAFLAPGAVSANVARSAVLLDRFFSYYLLVLVGAGLLIAYHRYRRIFV
ncbi:MAG TPA: lysylphosphatidylglycerol synthase transmembrane domain-containing protein [bacterium]|nr:lysylphosphatidylglycerol synthase transmembrane domain-containing protein [bacterium]